MNDDSVLRGRRQIVRLFGIGFATLGIAWMMYFIVRDGGWINTTNNGEFVDPPVNVAELQTGRVPFDVDGKWWLWYVATDCDETCVKTMHDLKSVHILLNRESTRVARAMLTTGGEAGLLQGDEQDKVRLLSKPAALEAGVYIVDPLGNLVLRYPVDTVPKPVLEDLKKLLKLSQIG